MDAHWMLMCGDGAFALDVLDGHYVLPSFNVGLQRSGDAALDVSLRLAVEVFLA
jgi:hypothetical protein